MALFIGNVAIDPPLVLAPMSGVTNRPFRLLCREYGAGLVCNEFVSAEGLFHGNPRSREYLLFDERERPISMQIFGSQEESVVAAARQVEAAGADLLDFNLGCAVRKIVRLQAGAYLLREPARVARLVRALVRAVRLPVTVKIRSGWDAHHLNAVEIARLCESEGAAAITVHGRTATQAYRGEANWDLIGEVKQAVSIPVIGNGDVREPQDAARMLAHTGCDAVMIGRAARGNPWIFKRAAHYLRTGELLPPPSPQERLATALRHGELLLQLKGEFLGLREMRKHLSWYTHGWPHAAALREEINRQTSWQGLVATLERYAEAQQFHPESSSSPA
jgi:tRNA-dihydrouridine synthase B